MSSLHVASVQSCYTSVTPTTRQIADAKFVRSVVDVSSPIASILHRDTIAALVGAATYTRGDECFRGGRVVRIELGAGQLRGVVRPQAAGRSFYEVKIWVKEDGIAYACSCP